jgi:tetratricopeptide (TPR) repeat protein
LVHRDIKPANVLLEEATGRAKIVDFGPVRRTSLPGGTTHEGSLPGTPEYMSPEQVRVPDRIDPRSDVYSLGVTLYEALTGAAPFRGVPHLVLQQVLSDDPPAPRRLNDRIPRDLETICLKAMAKEPGRRYQTAHDLGEDLRRWLNGEPIRARPVGVTVKLWRWCRRRPALAGLAAALVLTVAVGFAAVAHLWRVAEEQRGRAESHARQAEEHARQAGAQRRLAEQNLTDARRAVHQYYTLDAKPLPSGANGTRSQSRLAACHHGAGILLGETGKTAEAERSLAKARDLRARLAADHPGVPEFPCDLAASLVGVGNLQRQTGRTPEALGSFGEAQAILQKLVDAHPTVSRYQSDLAASANNLGNVLGELGRAAEALGAHGRALDLREKLVRDNPRVLQFRRDLAYSCLDLGNLQGNAGRPAEALRSYEKARDLLEDLVRADPAVVEFRNYLARAYRRIGDRHQRAGRPAESLAAYRQACAHFEELVQLSPDVPQFRRHLADSSNNLGILLSDAGRPAEALRSTRRPGTSA